MEYELQVRAKPQLGRREVWSHWSQPLAFRTVPAGTDGELRWGCSLGNGEGLGAAAGEALECGYGAL